MDTPKDAPEAPQAVTPPAPDAPEFNDVIVDSDKRLKTEKTFDMSYRDHDGVLHAGRFTCKRMTIGDFTRQSVLKARRAAGEKLPPASDYLNEMITYLEVTLIETPDWWDPDSFFDTTLIRAVYTQVRTWEDMFLGRGVKG